MRHIFLPNKRATLWCVSLYTVDLPVFFLTSKAILKPSSMSSTTCTKSASLNCLEVRAGAPGTKHKICSLKYKGKTSNYFLLLLQVQMSSIIKLIGFVFSLGAIWSLERKNRTLPLLEISVINLQRLQMCQTYSGAKRSLTCSPNLNIIHNWEGKKHRTSWCEVPRLKTVL